MNALDATRARRALLLISGVAVGVRALAALALRAWEAPNAIEHAAIASNLVAGLGFSFGAFGHFGPTSIQSPAYPILLAGLFWLFGVDSPAAYAAALGLNALLGIPLVLGTAAMARGMGAREREALLAAALVAVWPTQVYAATHAQAVSAIAAATVWMVALFQRGEREDGARAWLAYGFVACLASLTEPTLLPITVLSGVWMLLHPRLAAGLRLRRAAVLFGVALLVLGPWTLRNGVVHGRLMAVKSGFWVNVWKGANDYATGTDRMELPEALRRQLAEGTGVLDDARGETYEPPHQYEALTAAQLAELEGRSEVEREAIFRRYVIDWVGAHPRRFLELCGLRLWKTLWIDSDNPKAHHPAYALSRALLLVLWLPGLALAFAWGWRLLYPLLLLASCIGVFTLTLTAARFAFPLEPIQLAFAAASLGWLFDRLPSAWLGPLARHQQPRDGASR
jgi:hypothetical protein